MEERGKGYSPIQHTMLINGQYRPMATGNRNPYERPGYLGFGIASWAMKPTMAIQNPDTMKGQRFCTWSDQKAQMMVVMEAAT